MHGVVAYATTPCTSIVRIIQRRFPALKKIPPSSKRPHDREPIPEGLHIDDYFRRGNTSPADHYFKGHLAVPWRGKVLGLRGAAE